jgi:hypothetical protein
MVFPFFEKLIISSRVRCIYSQLVKITKCIYGLWLLKLPVHPVKEMSSFHWGHEFKIGH